jgi:putative flippase GtrA
VRLTLRLYERFQMLIHELAKFGIVGGIAFLVTEVGTNLLHFQVRLGPITSNVIATIVATCVSYAGNRFWTFRHRVGMDNLAGEYSLFFVLNAVGLAIQLACIGFTYYILGLTDKLSYNVALFLGIALGTLFRFWSYRKWVWRAHKPAAGAAGAADDQPHATPPGAPGYPGAVRASDPAAQGLNGNGRSAPDPGSAGTLPRRPARDMARPGAHRAGR